MVVPTKESVTFSKLMEWQIKSMYPVFFTGITGTGKSITCQKLLELTKTQQIQPVFMYFSAKSDSYISQKYIEQNFKGSGARGVIGPIGGFTKGVLMVDDVNMPLQETYEAQPPVELLRQLIGLNGVYDRTTKEFKKSKNLVCVCIAAPPTGCRAKLTKRFSKFFHILNFPKSSTETLTKIFNSIFSGWIQKTLTVDFHDSSQRIVQAAIKIYQETDLKLKPTPIKSHYSYNLRDVSKIIQGLMMSKKQTFPKKETLFKLVAHEAQRVFKDRLIDDIDYRIFDEILNKTVKGDLNLSGEDLSEIFTDQGVLFCNFIKGDLLCYVQTYNMIQSKLYAFLKDYNADSSDKMNLVFFLDAVKHICRISRVLKQARGNCLLVGISGSGRQSLTRLATKILT